MHDPAKIDTILNVVTAVWVAAFALVLIGGPLYIIRRRAIRRADHAAQGPGDAVALKVSRRNQAFGWLVMALLAIAGLALVLLFSSV